MVYRWVSVVALLIAGALSGCAFDVSHRKLLETGTPWSECPYEGGSCRKDASVQHIGFRTKDGASGSYLLGFVEFDDQGWYHDRGQQLALFSAVREWRTQNSGARFLMVAFAHGWHHSAVPGDPDIGEFQKLLERLDLLEKRMAEKHGGEPRKVVGVYLGWRGEALKIPWLKKLSFWTRKNAGERVGERSAKQFLTELNEFRAYLNGWNWSDGLATRKHTQLILVGHSFGGLVMYRALQSTLMERAVRIEKDQTGGYRYDMAKSFGDFIVLVNPAFEGASYEPLLKVAQSRCFTKAQKPVMAIVTSKADLATKVAFPIGRLYTLTQSAPQSGEREAVMHTVGHLDRYITHDAVFVQKTMPAPMGLTARSSIMAASVAAPAPVSQDGLSPTRMDTLDVSIDVDSPRVNDAVPGASTITPYDGAVLVSRGTVDPLFPYLVVSADANLIPVRCPQVS